MELAFFSPNRLMRFTVYSTSDWRNFQFYFRALDEIHVFSCDQLTKFVIFFSRDRWDARFFSRDQMTKFTFYFFLRPVDEIRFFCDQLTKFVIFSSGRLTEFTIFFYDRLMKIAFPGFIPRAIDEIRSFIWRSIDEICGLLSVFTKFATDWGNFRFLLVMDWRIDFSEIAIIIQGFPLIRGRIDSPYPVSACKNISV